MTADGKIAPASRRFEPFGGPRDRAHLLELRATADAVMAGARTVDLDRVNMGPGPVKYRRAAFGAAWRNTTCASSSAARERLIPRRKFSGIGSRRSLF
jgi:hypothetical protein